MSYLSNNLLYPFLLFLLLQRRTVENFTEESEHGAEESEHGTEESEHDTEESEHGAEESEHGTEESEHGTEIDHVPRISLFPEIEEKFICQNKLFEINVKSENCTDYISIMYASIFLLMIVLKIPINILVFILILAVPAVYVYNTFLKEFLMEHI